MFDAARNRFTKPDRILVAAVTSTFLTLVFLPVRFALDYLFENPLFIAVCFGAAFLSSLLLVPGRRAGLLSASARFSGILLCTYFVLVAGQQLYRELFSRRTPNLADSVKRLPDALLGLPVLAWTEIEYGLAISEESALFILLAAALLLVLTGSLVMRLTVASLRRHQLMTEPERSRQVGIVLAVLCVAALALHAGHAYIYRFQEGQMFPFKSVDFGIRDRTLRSEWYSNSLRAMNEPSFWDLSQHSRNESYRFTWIPSFDRPVAVRINLSGGDVATVTTTILTESRVSELAKVWRKASRELSAGEINEVRRALARARFWWMRSRFMEDGLDGNAWIIEGIKWGHYHVVDRWSPDDGPFRELGTLLMNLSDMRCDDFEDAISYLRFQGDWPPADRTSWSEHPENCPDVHGASPPVGLGHKLR